MRLSLVLDSLAVPAWVAQVVRRLLLNPLVKVEGISTTGIHPEAVSSSLLYRLYYRWDVRRNQSEFNPYEVVDLTSELAGIRRATADEMEADAAVWLSSSGPEGSDVQKFTCGVLQFVPSEPQRRFGGPPYFWELFRDEPVCGSAWELSGAGKEPVITAEGYSATEIGWSLRRNQLAPYGKAPALLEKSLYRLSRHCSSDGKEALPPALQTEPGQPRVEAGAPSSLQLGTFIAKNLRRSIHRRVAYRGKEPYWFVAYRFEPKLFMARTEQFQTEGFQILNAPADRFFADPFVISSRGKTYVFVEDYPYREAKGVISALELSSDGRIGRPERVLDRPYHLSYPFVFEHEGEIYMIPETMSSRRIELYRATAFPAGWELVRVLKEDVDAVDTTLWIQDGTYYFFTNVVDRGATPNDLLYLYLSDSLFGEWRPHPANPISADVRSSRSAGCLFRRGDKLIRPAQDCSIRYGYACQLNEIEVLSPTEYRERPVSRIEPNWYPGLIGTHTINSNESIEVIDGQIYRSR
ncbi:MAG: hypothetical protein ACJ74Y_05670 [Bryobacteraceae bacterium]